MNYKNTGSISLHVRLHWQSVIQTKWWFWHDNINTSNYPPPHHSQSHQPDFRGTKGVWNPPKRWFQNALLFHVPLEPCCHGNSVTISRSKKSSDSGRSVLWWRRLKPRVHSAAKKTLTFICECTSKYKYTSQYMYPCLPHAVLKRVKLNVTQSLWR